MSRPFDPEEKIVGTNHFMMCSRGQKDHWREKFIESNDPTGYVFAEEWTKYGYRRWKAFSESSQVKKEIDEWKETLEAKMTAMGIVRMASQKDNFQAMKWLADRGWVQREDKRTKEYKKKKERVSDEIAADMKRLGLKVVSQE